MTEHLNAPMRLTAILGTAGVGGGVHLAERIVPERHGAEGLPVGQGTGSHSPASVLAGVRATAPSLDAFIGEELQKRGLSESDAASSASRRGR
jgi:hypothetical protein